ncbi:MAG: rhomboid family intramembrane serine protease [Bacteroidota bacterium]
MLFPISDDDRALSGVAYVSITLLVCNVLLFLVQLGSDEFTYGWSVIPYEITTGDDLTRATMLTGPGGERVQIPHQPGPGGGMGAPLIYLTLLSAMFMHGGWMHLGGNMLYLWIFGDNVEHRFGALPFLGFYLVSGLAATAAQIVLDPDSLIPNLGASGAISGVLGAYLVLFPRNKVNAIFFYMIVSIPAMVAIGAWIALQFVSGWGAVFASEQTGGVAYGAHIGGFFAGMILALVMRTIIRENPNDVLVRVSQRDRSYPLGSRDRTGKRRWR